MKKYRICAAVAASALLCTGVTAFATSEEVRMSEITCLGDADNNETVSVSDLVNLSKHLLFKGNTVSLNADLSADGALDSLDLALLRGMLTGSFQPNDFTGLLINEICASNKACWSDADGREPDWVELYNSADTDVDISGYGLADGKKNLFKYTFPEGTIVPANGYLIVCCDDGLTSTDPSELHAPFMLSAVGETMYLTHPVYGTLDVVEMPVAQTDITYGRYENGSGSFGNLTPTPGATNDTAQRITVVAEPSFSVESGFYDAEFFLDVTSSEGCRILYTTDGTDPTTSSSAMTYDSSIRIYDNTYDRNEHVGYDISLYDDPAPSFNVDKGHVIRAVCVDADGNYSDVVSKSYYVNKTASYYKNMKVVSIMTDPANLFDDDTGIYVVGNKYYNWVNSSEYNPNLEEWDVRNPTNYNQSGIEWERPVDIQVFENGTLAFEDSVGMRIAGNATRSNQQKSLRLYARSEYGSSKMKYAFFNELADINGNPITEFDKVTIRNHGNDISEVMMRDDIVQQLARDAGMDLSTQASENCIVFIDGEFWGFYSLVERLEDNYVESHYGIDKNDVTTIKVYEVEGDAAVGQSYIDFFDWAMDADMSLAENYQRVCDTIDMQSFMDYITIESYVCNWDWCNENGTNNWQLWRSNTVDPSNPYADGKWRYMLFDTEYSSGLYDSATTSHNYDVFANMNRKEEWGNIGALFYKLLENEEFKAEFEENYRYHVENSFDYETKVAPIIDKLAAERKAATAKTFTRFQGEWGEMLASTYDENLNKLRTFYQNRARYALQHLEKVLGGSSSVTPSGEEMINDSTLWDLYVEMSSGANAIYDVQGNNSVTVNTTGLGNETWHVQPGYSPITLENGKTYQFTYTVKSDRNGTISAFLQRDAEPYDSFTWERRDVGTTAQTFTQTFTMNEDCSIVKLGFDCGYNVGTFYISDVSLTCIG